MAFCVLFRDWTLVVAVRHVSLFRLCLECNFTAGGFDVVLLIFREHAGAGTNSLSFSRSIKTKKTTTTTKNNNNKNNKKQNNKKQKQKTTTDCQIVKNQYCILSTFSFCF